MTFVAEKTLMALSALARRPQAANPVTRTFVRACKWRVRNYRSSGFVAFSDWRRTRWNCFAAEPFDFGRYFAFSTEGAIAGISRQEAERHACRKSDSRAGIGYGRRQLWPRRQRRSRTGGTNWTEGRFRAARYCWPRGSGRSAWTAGSTRSAQSQCARHSRKLPDLGRLSGWMS
jgi:hypothetical protein